MQLSLCNCFAAGWFVLILCVSVWMFDCVGRLVVIVFACFRFRVSCVLLWCGVCLIIMVVNSVGQVNSFYLMYLFGLDCVGCFTVVWYC